MVRVCGGSARRRKRRGVGCGALLHVDLVECPNCSHRSKGAASRAQEKKRRSNTKGEGHQRPAGAPAKATTGTGSGAGGGAGAGAGAAAVARPAAGVRTGDGSTGRPRMKPSNKALRHGTPTKQRHRHKQHNHKQGQKHKHKQKAKQRQETDHRRKARERGAKLVRAVSPLTTPPPKAACHKRSLVRKDKASAASGARKLQDISNTYK